jgi:hypothetical protein
MSGGRDMTIEADRVRRLIEAYGADPERWPEGERGGAEAAAAASPDLRLALQREAALDDLLGALPAVHAGAALRRAVLAVPERTPAWRDWLAALWPFDGLWRPAAGLATAAVLGLAIGLATVPAVPDAAADETVEISGQLAALLVAAGGDEGVLPP